MPGRPVQRALVAKIEKLGGAAWVEAQLSAGRMQIDLADELGASRSLFYQTIKANPEFRAAVERSRQAQCEAMSEEAVEIVDDLCERDDLTSQDVQLAKERVNVRRWFTQVNHPDKFAPKPQTAAPITLNIGTLHLDALRKTRVIDVTPGVAITRE